MKTLPKEIQTLIDRVNELTRERDYWKNRCMESIKRRNT